MNSIFTWIAKRFINEDLIVDILVKLLSLPITDDKLTELGTRITRKICENGERLGHENWEKIESAIQHRLDTLFLAVQKEFDKNET